MNVTVKKENYPWGTLRVVEKGIDYKAVIHPDDFDGITYCDGRGFSFTDEQNVTWDVTRDGDVVTFVSGHKRLVVSYTELS